MEREELIDRFAFSPGRRFMDAARVMSFSGWPAHCVGRLGRAKQKSMDSSTTAPAASAGRRRRLGRLVSILVGGPPVFPFGRIVGGKVFAGDNLEKEDGSPAPQEGAAAQNPGSASDLLVFSAPFGTLRYPPTTCGLTNGNENGESSHEHKPRLFGSRAVFFPDRDFGHSPRGARRAPFIRVAS